MPERAARNNMNENYYDFRWGVPQLDYYGGVHLYGFMLRNYARAGITRDEFLCLIHLAAYHFNSPQGKSKPARGTLALLMGYGHPNSVSRLVESLISKGMLTVKRISGETNIYSAHNFSRRMIELDKQATLTSQCDPPSHWDVTEESE